MTHAVLTEVAIHDFRNLRRVTLEPSPDLNIFVGPNGSGKTSFLEAVYHIGSARSFKSRIAENIIRHGAERAVIFAKTEDTVVGVERARGAKGTRVRLNGCSLHTSQRLAELFPVHVIDITTHQLVSGGAGFRRQLIDWGVFHVKHEFWSILKSVNKLLRQRNELLRRKVSSKDMDVWNLQLGKMGELLDVYRQEYLEEFIPFLKETLERYIGIDKLEFEYVRGWNRERRLVDVLRDETSKDMETGYTQHGPHRAELKIKGDNGFLVRDIYSRGQQKILANAIKIAQLLFLQVKTSRTGILLIDDLPSELDGTRQKMMADFVRCLQSQIFITGINEEQFGDMFCHSNVRMFHVKQGEIEKII